MERELIKISVRELVEFILRSGDIDNRVGGKKQLTKLPKNSWQAPWINSTVFT